MTYVMQDTGDIYLYVMCDNITVVMSTILIMQLVLVE